jgi:hypothetical protein
MRTSFSAACQEGTMNDRFCATPLPTGDDREARVQELLGRLRPGAEQLLRRMAERLVDLPEEQAFGQVEYDLRDLGHELAAAAHQAGLEAGKKRGTEVPASSARTAPPTRASSSTAPRAG